MTGRVLLGCFPVQVTSRYESSTPYIFSFLILHRSSQLVSILVRVEDGSQTALLLPVVLEHLAVHSHIVALDGQSSLGGLGIDNEVVIAVRAVFVGLFELGGILSEALLALFAGKGHLEGLHERVGFLLGVALDAVKPFLA